MQDIINKYGDKDMYDINNVKDMAHNHPRLLEVFISNNRDYFTMNKSKMRSFYSCIHKNEILIIQTLIKYNCNLNFKLESIGENPLQYAIQYNKYVIIELLFNYYKNNGTIRQLINEDAKLLYYLGNINRKFPIILFRNIISYVDDINKEINFTFSNKTVLLTMCKYFNVGLIEHLEILLENNADPNILYPRNSTILMEIVSFAKYNAKKYIIPVVELLLKHGADKNVVGDNNKKAIDYISDECKYKDELTQLLI